LHNRHDLEMLLLHTLALPATSSSVKRRFSLKRSAQGSVHYLRASTFLVVSPVGSKHGDFLAHRHQHLRGERASTKMVDEPLTGWVMAAYESLPPIIRMVGGAKTVCYSI
jgi:hypothetical protein